ncbi:MAG: YceI family protein [Cellvibrionales bacterium]|nr:YceI family protein [Cellvibrionales bacterium]
MRTPILGPHLIAALALLLGTVQAHAQALVAQLDSDNSSLSFVSVKAGDIGEVHRFTRLSGGIAEGRLRVDIEVASLDSGIAIRDKRMLEHLFRAADHPRIRVEATVAVDQIPMGASQREVDAELLLLGKSHPVRLAVTVVRMPYLLQVAASQPLMLNAASLGLTDALRTLGGLVGGIPISAAVPVYFNLIFALAPAASSRYLPYATPNTGGEAPPAAKPD